MQTYIDCVHVKKAEKGRMQADDPMEADKDGNKEGEQERDTEGNSSDAVNEAKVLEMPFSNFHSYIHQFNHAQ